MVLYENENSNVLKDASKLTQQQIQVLEAREYGDSPCCQTIHRLLIEGNTKCLGKGLCNTTLKVSKWVACTFGCDGDSDMKRSQQHGCGYAPCEFKAQESSNPHFIKFVYSNKYIECRKKPDITATSPGEGQIIVKTTCEPTGTCGSGKGSKPWTKKIKHKCCPQFGDLGTVALLNRTLWLCEHYYFTKAVTTALSTAAGLPINPITLGCTEENIKMYKEKINLLQYFQPHKQRDKGYTLHYECIMGLVRDHMGTPSPHASNAAKLIALADGTPMPREPLTNKDLLGSCKCFDAEEEKQSAVKCCENEPSLPTGDSVFSRVGSGFKCGTKYRWRELHDWFHNVIEGICPKISWKMKRK